jgi:hypothetical protein
MALTLNSEAEGSRLLNEFPCEYLQTRVTNAELRPQWMKALYPMNERQKYEI